MKLCRCIQPIYHDLVFISDHLYAYRSVRRMETGTTGRTVFLVRFGTERAAFFTFRAAAFAERFEVVP